MYADTPVFSSFSVDDLAAAKQFYGETLGVKVDDGPMGLTLRFAGGAQAHVYGKPNHQPASFTILNFVVDDIDKAVDDLVTKGVEFERYPDMHQDDKGIARGIAANMGPDIAWFTDPAGNVLSVLHSAN